MMTTLAGLAIAVTPFLAIMALLRLVDRIARRRDVAHARQIALTDAIHRELGAVAAPTVRRRFGGGWRVDMAVPANRPGTTAALVRITERMFVAPGGREAKRFRMLLTPAAPPLGQATSTRDANRRRVHPAAPALS